MSKEEINNMQTECLQIREEISKLSKTIHDSLSKIGILNNMVLEKARVLYRELEKNEKEDILQDKELK